MNTNLYLPLPGLMNSIQATGPTLYAPCVFY